MTYHSKMEWRSGKEIDAQVNQTIFKLQAKDYIWKKRLSLKPRRCHWTGDFIRPFTNAMVAHYPEPMHIINVPNSATVTHNEKNSYPDRWVSMSTYIFLKLEGKL